jgi:hypothetical protein
MLLVEVSQAAGEAKGDLFAGKGANHTGMCYAY